jgi:molybdopterin-guanine dinucleotide biosynthesis protein A
MAQRDLSQAAAPAVVAVLAGGLGRRLGGAKAAAQLAGRPLISYPLAAAAAAGLPAIVVAKRASELPAVQAAVVHEPDEPRHPLCGVLAALRYAGACEQATRDTARAGTAVLAVGCDMPFLNAPLLAWLAALRCTAAAFVDGRLQPLPALYMTGDAPALEAALGRRDSMRAALEQLSARRLAEHELGAFGDPRRLLFGVNDARDLKDARGWLR